MEKELYTYPCGVEDRATCDSFLQAQEKGTTLREFCNEHCEHCPDGRVFDLPPEALDNGQSYAFGLRINKETKKWKKK